MELAYVLITRFMAIFLKAKSVNGQSKARDSMLRGKAKGRQLVGPIETIYPHTGEPQALAVGREWF